MRRVTDAEVAFILDDISARGVVLEDLQHNLLDHVCCIIEDEMPETEDFKEFYRKVIPRFFKHELKELQEETDQLLTFKHYYAMKKTLKIVGLGSVGLILAGALFKIFHWPGAGLFYVLGMVVFGLLFLPLMIVLKTRDEGPKLDKFVFGLGFLVAMSVTLGTLFKIMHWPGANMLMVSSLAGFMFVFLPL